MESIHDVLRRNGVAADALKSILDYGCGCGRVIRHWPFDGAARLFGTDQNPRLIEWCQHHLPFASFDVNDLRPPLRYGNEAFDLVYALSVFTHMTEDLQLLWMEELRRVLRPGGYLLMTTHGASYLNQLDPAQQAEFRSGQLVVRNTEFAGSNECGAFHPEQYVREKLIDGFEVLDFVPEGAKGNPTQDVYLLRKKPRSRLKAA